MSAYLVVLLNVQSTEWVADYVANVPTIFRKFGGEYIAVSNRVVLEEGDATLPDQIALLTFPSVEAIESFPASDEYAPYAAARIAASSATIFALEA